MYFKVPVSWTMMGEHVVYAKNKDEAIHKAYDMNLPAESEYLSCSLEVDEEGIEEVKMPHEGRKFPILALSTQHIRPEDAIWLNQKDCPLMAYQKTQCIMGRSESANYGWFVFFEKEDVYDEDIPESIRVCLKYAIGHECDCIMLDCDEDPVNDLPVYRMP